MTYESGPAESALVIERFGRRYRRDRPWAVRGVSLAVPEGSITALDETGFDMQIARPQP